MPLTGILPSSRTAVASLSEMTLTSNQHDVHDRSCSCDVRNQLAKSCKSRVVFPKSQVVYVIVI